MSFRSCISATMTVGVFLVGLVGGACKAGGGSGSGDAGSGGKCTQAEDCPRGFRCVGQTCVGHPPGVTQAAVDDARAKIVGSWRVDWPAQQQNPNVQKMDEEHRAKTEASAKLISFVFRPDNTVDVNMGEKANRGTWNMSSSFEGSVGVQILTGDGKGSDNMELKVSFNGPDRMKLDLGALNVSFALLRQ
jgi:hypothetical protein